MAPRPLRKGHVPVNTTEGHQHEEPTRRHQTAYEAHDVLVLYGFAQISRPMRWG